MGDSEFWSALKRHKREKFDADRRQFLSRALACDDGGWVKHTAHHWSRTVNGERLDYWPSRNKWRYRGAAHRGDVMAFIGKLNELRQGRYGT